MGKHGVKPQFPTVSDLYDYVIAMPTDDNGCRCDWPRYIGTAGYPQIAFNKVNYLVHRLILAQKLGRPLGIGKQALHICDNKKCLSPDHLYEGTHEQNMLDMRQRGRAAKGSRNGAHLYPERRPHGLSHGRYTKPERTARGERNSSAVYSDAQVSEIRELRLQGWSYAEIQSKYPMHTSTLCRILTNRTRVPYRGEGATK